MVGLLTLSHPIYCTKEVMGKIFSASIADIPCKIHFPRLPIIDENDPVIGMQNPLLPPVIAANWRRGNAPLFWGDIRCYPFLGSSVELLALSFDDDNCEEKAQLIYEEFYKWENAFVDYLTILKKQNIARDKNNHSSARVEFLSSDNDAYAFTKKIYLHFLIDSYDLYAKEEDITEAIVFIMSGKELCLEYQLLLSAYKARIRCLNRHAIIDACSAVEISLVNYINNKSNELGLNNKIFLDKYRSLGDRFTLVSLLGATIPVDDYGVKIVKPRNDIAHCRSTAPSDETTDRLITCVEQCLAVFSENLY